MIGAHIQRSDKFTREIEEISHKAGNQIMFNLTVDQVHTFFVGDGKWLVHNTCPIKGRAQVTDPNHAPKVTTEAQRLQGLQDPYGNDLYKVIYLIKSLKTATGGVVKSLLRPDIAAVDIQGNFHLVDVVSSTQNPLSMTVKINDMLNLLATFGLRGTGSVIP